MSLQGYLLVASTAMLDPNFARTVILLLHHNEDGAFGLVLNRPLSGTIKQLWEKVSNAPGALEGRINFGGPVSGPVMALHGSAALGEVQVPPGIYLAAERQNLERLVHQTQVPFRIFIGHAGWGRGQLEHELSQGAWLVVRAKPDHVFADPDELWQDLIREIGWNTLQSVLKIKHVPPDVTWN